MTDHVASAAVPMGLAGVFRWRPVRAQMASARTEDIWFLDADSGWAVDSNGGILHTADGGVTFARQLHEPDVYFACIAFVSP